MRALGVVVVGVVCTVFGAVLGAFIPFQSLSSRPDPMIVLRAESDLATHLGVLRRLHSGETHIAEQLVQSHIDGALIWLDISVRKGSVLSPRTYERIDQIRRLRQEHPYESSEPNIAAAVRRALEIHPPISQ